MKTSTALAFFRGGAWMLLQNDETKEFLPFSFVK